MFEETSLDTDREVIELNVLGVLSLTKQVLPHMLERKEGHIAVMSSIAGKLGTFWSQRKIGGFIYFSEIMRKNVMWWGWGVEVEGGLSFFH